MGNDVNNIQRENTYGDLLNLAAMSGLVGGGIGLGVGGIKLLRDHLRNKEEDTRSVAEEPVVDPDIAVGTDRRVPKMAEAPGLAPTSTKPEAGFFDHAVNQVSEGALPGLLSVPAAILPAVLAYGGVNYGVDVLRKKKLNERVEQARHEFEAALAGDTKNAAVKAIDEIYDLFKASGFTPQPPPSSATYMPPELTDGVATFKATQPPPGTPAPRPGVTDANMWSLLGWLGAGTLGLGATGGLLYGAMNRSESPEVKKRKALKELLKRREAGEALGEAPTITGAPGDLGIKV